MSGVPLCAHMRRSHHIAILESRHFRHPLDISFNLLHVEVIGLHVRRCIRRAIVRWQVLTEVHMWIIGVVTEVPNGCLCVVILMMLGIRHRLIKGMAVVMVGEVVNVIQMIICRKRWREMTVLYCKVAIGEMIVLKRIVQST